MSFDDDDGFENVDLNSWGYTFSEQLAHQPPDGWAHPPSSPVQLISDSDGDDGDDVQIVSENPLNQRSPAPPEVHPIDIPIGSAHSETQGSDLYGSDSESIPDVSDDSDEDLEPEWPNADCENNCRATWLLAKDESRVHKARVRELVERMHRMRDRHLVTLRRLRQRLREAEARIPKRKQPSRALEKLVCDIHPEDH